MSLLSVMRRPIGVWSLTSTVFCIALLLATGCAKSGNSDSGAAAASGGAGGAGGGGNANATLVTAGKTVYAANGCARCHAMDGQGGRGGPDLTRVGAGAEHTSEWLVAHIKNPKAHNPGSRMPSFQGRISDKDLFALGAYLASLK